MPHKDLLARNTPWYFQTLLMGESSFEICILFFYIFTYKFIMFLQKVKG